MTVRKTEILAIHLIAKYSGKALVISLDHDLEIIIREDPDPGDGRGVVKWLSSHKTDAPMNNTYI